MKKARRRIKRKRIRKQKSSNSPARAPISAGSFTFSLSSSRSTFGMDANERDDESLRYVGRTSKGNYRATTCASTLVRAFILQEKREEGSRVNRPTSEFDKDRDIPIRFTRASSRKETIRVARSCATVRATRGSTSSSFSSSSRCPGADACEILARIFM